jgi:hypothetical protein
VSLGVRMRCGCLVCRCSAERAGAGLGVVAWSSYNRRLDIVFIQIIRLQQWRDSLDNDNLGLHYSARPVSYLVRYPVADCVISNDVVFFRQDLLVEGCAQASRHLNIPLTATNVFCLL